jgi:hypothetical protein
MAERTPRLNELIEEPSFTRSSLLHTQSSTNFDRKIAFEKVISGVLNLMTEEDFNASTLEAIISNSSIVGYYNIYDQATFEYYFGSSSDIFGGTTGAGWAIGGTVGSPLVAVPANTILRFRAGTYTLKRNLTWSTSCLLIGEGDTSTVITKDTYAVYSAPGHIYNLTVDTENGTIVGVVMNNVAVGTLTATSIEAENITSENISGNVAPTANFHGQLQNGAATHATVFNALKDYIPENGDSILVHGSYSYDAGGSNEFNILTSAERLSPTQIKIYSSNVRITVGGMGETDIYADPESITLTNAATPLGSLNLSW